MHNNNNNKLLASASKQQTFYRETKFDTIRCNNSNTQSASSTKHFKCAYSQSTLHSLMNKKTREKIVAKLATVYGFHPRTVCKSEFISQAFSDNGMLFQNNLNCFMQLVYKHYEIAKDVAMMEIQQSL